MTEFDQIIEKKCKQQDEILQSKRTCLEGVLPPILDDDLVKLSGISQSETKITNKLKHIQSVMLDLILQLREIENELNKD